MRSRQFQCRECGGVEGYRSRPRTFIEKYMLPVLFLRPVRCCACYRRYYVPIFVHVHERNEPDTTHHAAA